MWGAQHVQQNAGVGLLSMLSLYRQSKRPINKFDYFCCVHALASNDEFHVLHCNGTIIANTIVGIN